MGAFARRRYKKVQSALVPTLSLVESDVLAMVHREKMQKIVTIVDTLLQHPDRIDTVATVAAKDVSKMGGARSREDIVAWPDQYSTWQRILAYWLWQWVQDSYDEFSVQLVEKLIKTERGILRKLLQFATGIHDHMEVDPRLRDKLLMSKFLWELAAARGHRLRGWTERAFKDRKTITWNFGGCYQLVEAEGKVTHIIWVGDPLNKACP